MKVSVLFCALVFLFQFSVSIPAQTTGAPVAAQTPETSPATIRAARIKADILQEAEKLPGKDRAYRYAQLGNLLWRRDRKEGFYWLEKAVELGTSPAAEYKDDAEKLTYFWNLLVNVLDEDAGLANKVLAQIKQIKIDESNPAVLERANKTYILIAEQLAANHDDEKNAFEFAMLSLKGKKPAINWDAAEFFRPLKVKNENLANAYFAKLLEVAKFSGDKTATSLFVHYFAISRTSNYPLKDPRFVISDTQRKDLLELVFPIIQNEAEKLALKKINYCGVITGWGLEFLEDYKRLLPEKSVLVEQAIAVCQNAEIEPWKKPDFLKRPRQTSQDLLNLAKEITDKRIQANYLTSAASRARAEKNYRLSNSILESIEKDDRDPLWGWWKIETLSEWIAELFNKNELSEIHQLLDSTPAELVPFIIVRLRYSIRAQKPEQKKFIFNLMETARAGFNKIEKFPKPPDYTTNPTRFGELTAFYVKYGFYDEAAATHEESIKSLNRLIKTLPPEFKDKPIPYISSYSRFTNQYPPADSVFIDKYFDRIYENIGEIEDSRIRISERMNFLGRILENPPTQILVPISRKSGE